MSRDERLYLEDIQMCCEKVLRFTEDLDFDAFRGDEKTFDAVVRNLEIIGEAAKHVSPELRDRYPDVSWRDMAGFRDVVTHTYFRVNAYIVWDVIETKIPMLLEQMDWILDAEPSSDHAERDE